MTNRYTVLASLVVFAGLAGTAAAQPTYRLGVKPDLKPLATLKLDGSKIVRTDLDDDPGFRIQYHFKKDGKTLSQVEARSSDTLEVPQKEAGTYTVVLELFYPGYKTGTVTKGEFKPVSNVLTYTVQPGAKPEDPVTVTFVEPPKTPPPAPAPTPEKKP